MYSKDLSDAIRVNGAEGRNDGAVDAVIGDADGSRAQGCGVLVDGVHLASAEVARKEGGKKRDKKREEAGAFTVNPNGWPTERVVPSKQVMVTVYRWQQRLKLYRVVGLPRGKDERGVDEDDRVVGKHRERGAAARLQPTRARHG